MTQVDKKITFGWGVMMIIASIAFSAGALFLKVDYLTEEVADMKISIAQIQSALMGSDKFALKK